MIQMNLSLKQKRDHGQRQNGGCQGEGEWGAGISRYKLVYIKWVNKGLPIHTGARFSIPGHTVTGKNTYTCSTSQHLSRSGSVATEAHLPGPCLSTTIHKPGSLSSQLHQSLEENIFYRRDASHMDKVSREGIKPQSTTGTSLT